MVTDWLSVLVPALVVGKSKKMIGRKLKAENNNNTNELKQRVR